MATTSSDTVSMLSIAAMVAGTDKHANRTLVAAVVLTSICVYGRFIPMYQIAFIPEYTLKKLPPQIWRLATPFWLTGPKFNMLMDPVACTCALASQDIKIHDKNMH